MYRLKITQYDIPMDILLKSNESATFSKKILLKNIKRRFGRFNINQWVWEYFLSGIRVQCIPCVDVG
jgi:hypothetical protein